jgi:cell division protein FtsB
MSKITARLRAENEKLQTEVDRLRAENGELRAGAAEAGTRQEGASWRRRMMSRQAQFRLRTTMPDLPLMTLMVLATAFAIEVAWLIYA